MYYLLGREQFEGDRIKLDSIIKISEKFATHVPHVDELYNIKTLNKIIGLSISKDVRHPLYRFFFLINLSLSLTVQSYYDKNRMTL